MEQSKKSLRHWLSTIIGDLRPLAGTFLDVSPNVENQITVAWCQLTARESEILGLLSKGYTNSSIANALFIDVKTVEHHINSMYSKLKAGSDFNDKHPRVSAARLYLEAVGELSTSAIS
ncbi:response regulator transcription factor [Chloroflexota bacterium]